MHINTNQSRRAFLQRASLLGATGAAAPLAASLGWIGEAAAAAGASDYKALVCVFLYGGNDYANTLPPYDAANYNAYLAARPSLALNHGQLAATALRQANDMGGRQYALNPALAPLLPIFDGGHMAPVLNVGNLVMPTTKAQYQSKSVLLPPKLFSHNDQQTFCQSSQPEGADAGWGGRIGDLVQSSNGSAALTCITVNGNAVMLAGPNTTPFAVSPGKVEELLFGNKAVYGSSTAYQSLIQLMTGGSECFFAQEHAKISRRSIELGSAVSQALAHAPEANFTTFPANGNNLSDQLKMVARLISIAPGLGLKRQVFFVGMGGWDTHSGMAVKHPALLDDLADSLRGFYDATVQLGVADKVSATYAIPRHPRKSLKPAEICGF